MKSATVVRFAWMPAVVASGFTLAWLGYIDAAAWVVVLGAVAQGVESSFAKQGGGP